MLKFFVLVALFGVLAAQLGLGSNLGLGLAGQRVNAGFGARTGWGGQSYPGYYGGQSGYYGGQSGYYGGQYGGSPYGAQAYGGAQQGGYWAGRGLGTAANVGLGVPTGLATGVVGGLLG